MRTLHIHFSHKSDWHLVRHKIIGILRDPLFWVFVSLVLISIALFFYVMLVPGHPQPVYSPYYPFLG